MKKINKYLLLLVIALIPLTSGAASKKLDVDSEFEKLVSEQK